MPRDGWDGLATTTTSKKLRKRAAKHAQRGADLRKSGKSAQAKRADKKARKSMAASNELRKRGY